MNAEFEDLEEDVNTYFMLHIDKDGNGEGSPKKAFLKDDIEWFFKKNEGKKICHVTPCHNSMFFEFPCLEDENRYGFFKSEADIRPSSCTWIEKDKAEKLYKLFRKGTK